VWLEARDAIADARALAYARVVMKNEDACAGAALRERFFERAMELRVALELARELVAIVRGDGNVDRTHI
jgi:hypothetical protein